ncbi:GNAT family N-acetyltransferase [Vibrio hibernica]|uniref:GNAT family N-acetyltransferase n=1 Tax=Vibrio hibernica TaxID=2587465 RepID=UPI00188221E5|nr:GNAT family protein [Vibrio hibernica]
MPPDFTLTTSRLILRLIEADEAAIFADTICHSPSLYSWLDWCSNEFNTNDAQEFILFTRLSWVKDSAYGFGVFDKQTGQFIGMAALTDQRLNFNLGSLGYWIGDEYQKQGYATEAIKAVIEFSFTLLKLTRLEFICDPNNIISHKLAYACGAHKEGIAKNRYLFNGEPRDGLVFSLIPDK